MKAFARQLFRSDVHYGRALATLGMVAAVPSFVMVHLVVFLLLLSGVNPEPHTPKLDVSEPKNLINVLLLGPFIESFLVIFGVYVVARFVKSPLRVSAVSGVAWGIIHGMNAPLWFVGTFWSFFVFSMGYLVWRPFGLAKAFGAAWIPHLIQNSIAVGLALATGAT
jgi:hypothetical protein